MVVGLLALAAMAGSPLPAEDKAGAPAAREEMIDALIAYAASGGCEARRKIFGTALEATCSKAEAGGGDRMAMWQLLDPLPESELIALCRQNGIADCERPSEVSKGRSILTFDSAVDIEFNSHHAAWSPDGRLLLLDNLDLPAAEVRLLDVAAGRLLDPPLYAGPIHEAAWSPDGAYIALSNRKRTQPGQVPPVGSVLLYASGARRELARISAAEIGCSLGLLEGMAFTPDSKALWVLCSQSDKTAKAVRLKVPQLEVEESFVPASPIAGWSESYWEEGIVRSSDDLIVTVRFASPTPVKGPRSAVQSYSLRTTLPLYAPVYVPAVTAHLAPDLSELYVGDELWSTRTGQRVADGINPAGRYLGAPNRLPQLAMHIETKPQPTSRRSTVVVLDSASGAAVQEIGPLPPVVAILVAPNGGWVAAAAFHGIRFYRVNRATAGAPGPKGDSRSGAR
jgi:hypothetical protein